ncbi:MAG: type II toxin-antitoxin system Phd/YefM family antitoxin [Vulcanimicrobiota bacterium]
MKPSNIKPISFLKANASEMLRDLDQNGHPIVITQNGVAKAVMQDVRSYEKTQETLALLKLLALGSQQIEREEIEASSEVISKLRNRLNDR